jgi:hypothetical protein
MASRDTGARYRNAALRGTWFAAVFALVCACLAIASSADLIGSPADAPMLAMMSFGGVVLFCFGRVIIKLFRS